MERRSKVPIGLSLEILANHPIEIMTVSEWAYYMGYSRSYFCRSFRSEFGISPKRKLRVFRLRQIKKVLQSDPEAISFKVAIESGFNNEKALYQYLSFHCGMTLSQFKSHVI